MASMLLRAVGRQTIAKIGKQNTVFMIKTCGPMSTQQAYKDMDAFWKKNRKLDRPLSPHLSVYKPELPMLTSLAHRVTGIAMCLTVTGVSLFFLVAPGDYTYWLNLVQGLGMSSVIITSFKYLLAFPVCWHYINGIRHLAWDWAMGFGLPELYKTGYFALSMAILISTLFVFGFPMNAS